MGRRLTRSLDPQYPELARGPACLDHVDWLAWNRFTVLAGSVRDGVCADCTPERQQEMATAGRCEWAGRVRFEHEAGGGIVGRRMLHLKVAS